METVCRYSLSLKARNPDFDGLPVAAFHFSVKFHHLLVFVDRLGVPIDFPDSTLFQTSHLLEMPLCILSWQSLCERHLKRVLNTLGVPHGFWAGIIRVVMLMREAFWGLGDGHLPFDMNINLELTTKEEIEVEVEDTEESDPDQVTWGVSRSTIEELEKKNCSVQDCGGCCCICLDELSGVNKVIEIPCSHLFHSRCIVKWLERNDSCPLCRSKVEVEGHK